MKRVRTLFFTCMLFGIALMPVQSSTKPSGVTTIRGLDVWAGNLPTKGGNRFIILEQFNRDCGPTSAEMVLHYYTKWVTQRDIWDKGGIHTIHIGTFPNELDQALDRLGVPVHTYGGKNYSALKHYIREDKPCIILLQKGLKAYHWVVVVGYDNRDRFLIADPNGYFKWWDLNKLDRYWGFRNGSARGLKSDFINGAVSQRAGPYTWIVPIASPPGKHFGPMWSVMKETQITGRRKWNPLFKTERWEHNFQLSARPDYYKVTGVKPAQLGNAGGTAQAWISGSKIEGSTIKVWGQVEYGKVTQGKLWVVLRAYRKGALLNLF